MVSATLLVPTAATSFVEPAPGLARKEADPRRPLTPIEKRRTKRIASRHPLFKRLVDGRSYRFETIAPWSALVGKRHREIRLGSYARVVLTPAVPLLTAVWPLVCYPKDGSPSYFRWHAEITVHDLRKIAVNVDLRKRKLVALSPRNLSAIEYKPGVESPCGPSAPD
jgi:hypothetical protein